MLNKTFLKDHFFHYQLNRLVQSYIASEVLIWSAWNSAMSIIAVFATNQIKGGNVAIAATALSAHLMVRVGVELFTGRVLAHFNETKKFMIVMSGITLISLAYLGFSFTKSVNSFFLFYALAGVGLGIAAPLKNSLFSTHLDRNHEAMEWGIYDALVFMGMAASSAIGGIIAQTYGFQILFWLAAIINLTGILPYYLYAQKRLEKAIIGTGKPEAAENEIPNPSLPENNPL